MKLPADPAKRSALLAAGGLVIGLALVLAVFGPRKSEWRGMGLTRILQEEDKWRQDLWLQGSHINEQELWQIQETLAVRVQISTAGLKGLVRRAVNAKDAAYQANGHLLAGNTAVAAALAGKIAAARSTEKGGESEAARWLRRRADALWRGNLEDASPALNEALALAGDKDSAQRRELLKDLASWHWHRALFRPEDPAAELRRGSQAVESLLAFEPALPREDRVAGWRLRGRLLLRLACLNPQRDPGALEQAALSFQQALERLAEDSRGDLWASLHHDLGVARLERGDWPGAVESLRLALEVRDGKVKTGGRVDVRVIERRLNERLITLACLALAEARGAAGDSALLESARQRAGIVHGMTLPEDGGAPWIIAQAALVEIERATGDPQRAAVLAQYGSDSYPHHLAQEPGVPPLAFFEVAR